LKNIFLLNKNEEVEHATMLMASGARIRTAPLGPRIATPRR
jgi:hypothetical protein